LNSTSNDERSVFRHWWPLAASWLMMGLELPLVTATMARLPDPRISLAAYGGVVFPISLVIEGPIIMLLSASTAMARDRHSYELMNRFTWALAGALTAIHALVAFTPLFDIVAGQWLGVPVETLEPARIGLRILTPWTAAIAYRRYQQGVLIRYERTGWIGVGTAVRLAANLLVLGVGLAHGRVPGIVVGASAVAAGVLSEAAFMGIAVRPVLRQFVYPATTQTPPLRLAAFLRFYVPLALTPLIGLASLPLASAAVSRMPNAFDSLATWPALNGVVFLLRSVGFAFNEIVVARVEQPAAVPALRRFAIVLSMVVTGVLVLAVVTPLGHVWFEDASALSGDLAALAGTALIFSLALPALAVQQSWYQGLLVAGRKTRAVIEAVLVYVILLVACLVAGVISGAVTGLYVGVLANTIASLGQNLWMRSQARSVLDRLATTEAQR
jgi:hypothetical protein